MSNDALSEGPSLRSRVMARRRAGMSRPEISALLGVALEVVQAELDGFTREEGARLALEFSSPQVVAEARERFAFLIAATERESRRLDRTPGSSTTAKVKCIALLADLNERDAKFAYAVGLLSPITPRTTGSVPDASTIRERLRAAGVLDRLDHLTSDFDTEECLSDGERQWAGLPPRGSKEAEKEGSDGDQ